MSEWRRDERQYADRLLYRVGKVDVGAVDHPMRYKGESRISRATLYVPGMVLKSVDYATDEEAKARVEKSFKVWLSWLEESVGP